MSTVRIWAVKSDHEAKAVKSIANKLVSDWQLSNLSIQSAGRISSLVRKGKPLSDTLRKATQHYLNQDDCVIFVIERNSPMSIHPGFPESSSLFKETEKILTESHLAGKIFLAQGIQELNVWLPIAHKSLEGCSKTWQKEWDSIIASFHDAFAGTSEDEVARDLDETLAEVRCERT